MCGGSKTSAIGSEFYSGLMDQNETILWSSDYYELISVPPDNVLTEFPTFRDAADLVQYSWTGKTVYDVWDSGGIVRTGAWSSVQIHNDV